MRGLVSLEFQREVLAFPCKLQAENHRLQWLPTFLSSHKGPRLRAGGRAEDSSQQKEVWFTSGWLLGSASYIYKEVLRPPSVFHACLGHLKTKLAHGPTGVHLCGSRCNTRWVYLDSWVSFSSSGTVCTLACFLPGLVSHGLRGWG